jgi:uncharacterized protein (DUF302 family)
MSVEKTTEKLVEKIKESGLTYFQTISYDKAVVDNGLKLDPTKTVLFEDSNLSAQLINCQQTSVLDLPLKILVWEEHKDVYIGFIDPKFMKKRFLVVGCDEIIESLTKIMVRVTNDTIRK